MAEELIAFPSKAEMLDEVPGVLEPGQDPVLGRLRRPAGHRPPGGLLHLRRRGQAAHRRPPQRRHLQPRATATPRSSPRSPRPCSASTSATTTSRRWPGPRWREALVTTAPPGLAKVVFGSGGGEAIDIALKTARHATKRRKIVSIAKAYHGHTGLAVATGDERFADAVPGRPAGRVRSRAVQRPGRDGATALRGRDVAAVIMETIPATYGFPLPAPGYLEGGQAAVRAARRAVHRGRGADRADAHRRAVGHHQARHRAGHPGHRQGHLRRHVPDQRGAGQRGGGGLAQRGRLRAHVHVRRRGTRLRGRAEDAGDHLPAGDQVDGALHRRPARRGLRRIQARATRTGSPASGRTAWSWAWSSPTRRAPSS